MSESIPQLRNDACWFANSDGDVKVVVLIGVDKIHKKITIETWEMFPAEPPRRSTRNTPAQVPKMMNIVCIDDFGTNAPLVSGELKLEFQHVFLRPAIPPKEKVHIEISSETLVEWAKNLRFYNK